MKKGFTLVELLGVIVILSIIGLIITPVVQNAISENTKKACLDQVKSFERAAKNYMSSKVYTACDEGCGITLKELQDEGFLSDGDLKNPKGGTFDKNSVVNINYNGTKYTFKYDYTC